MVTLIITFIILVLLVAPIVGLFELTQRHDMQTTDAVCFGVLLVSTLVFRVCCPFSRRRRGMRSLPRQLVECSVRINLGALCANAG